MEKIFYILFDIVFVILILFWIMKARATAAADKARSEEYNKPANVFKRKKEAFMDDISTYTNTMKYPYILLPTYFQKNNIKNNVIFMTDSKHIDDNLEVEFNSEKVFSGRSEAFFLID